MQIFEILTEVITLLVVCLTFVQICIAYHASLNEKYLELRFKTYSEFLEAFCELPSTIKAPPEDHLKHLIFHYHRIIVITPKQYIDVITNFYDKYVQYYTAALSATQKLEQLHDLAVARKEIILILNDIILSCDKSIFKRKQTTLKN